MRRIISTIFSLLRGEQTQFDSSIPVQTLVFYGVRKIFAAIRGGWRLCRFFPPVFIGRNVKLRSRWLIKISGVCNIDDGCIIDATSSKGIIIGKNVSINRDVAIECTGTYKCLGKGLVLGENVGIGSNSFLGCAGGIEIGENTILGNYVSMHAENHEFSIGSRPFRLQGVTRRGIKIGKNCWIGAKAIILDGVMLGDNSVVAAGAVLAAGEYKGGYIYAGVPAKSISEIKRSNTI